MRAGHLRERVTIRVAVAIDDQHFGTTDTEGVVAARVPARVIPLMGRALERAQMIDARTTHEVTIRYRRGVQSGQLLTHHDRDRERAFEIVAPPVDVAAGHVEMRLLCREQEVRA